MSTAITAPASTSLVTTITSDTLQYAPAVIAGIQAAELAGGTGQAKHTAVLNGILTGVQVGSAALAQSSTGQVQAISSLINLFVSIFNSLGLFKHSTITAASETA